MILLGIVRLELTGATWQDHLCLRLGVFRLATVRRAGVQVESQQWTPRGTGLLMLKTGQREY
jgi:hypothetical protein